MLCGSYSRPDPTTKTTKTQTQTVRGYGGGKTLRSHGPAFSLYSVALLGPACLASCAPAGPAQGLLHMREGYQGMATQHYLRAHRGPTEPNITERALAPPPPKIARRHYHFMGAEWPSRELQRSSTNRKRRAVAGY